MDLKDHAEKLFLFKKIVENGSIRATSKAIKISQPALARSVAIIENAAGGALLYRSGKGITPTPLGKKLYNVSLKLDFLIEEFRLSNHTSQNPMVIKFGAYESISIYLFPSFFKSSVFKNSKFNVSLSTDSSAALFLKLKNRKVDMILSVNPPKDKSVISYPLYSDEFSFFYSPELDSLENCPVILDKSIKDADGISLGEMLKRTSLSKRETLNCQSIESIKTFTLEGMGLGLLPTRVARSFVEKGLLYKFKDKEFPAFLSHNVALSIPKTLSGESSIESLIALLKNYLSKADNNK